MFLIAIRVQTNRIFRDINREHSPYIDRAVGASISISAAAPSAYSSEMIVLAGVIYCSALDCQPGDLLELKK